MPSQSGKETPSSKRSKVDTQCSSNGSLGSYFSTFSCTTSPQFDSALVEDAAKSSYLSSTADLKELKPVCSYQNGGGASLLASEPSASSLNMFDSAEMHSNAAGSARVMFPSAAAAAASFPSQCYSGSVWDNQSFPGGVGLYGIQPASHYSTFAHHYGMRSFKSSPASAYSLNPYFQTGAAQHQLSSYYSYGSPDYSAYYSNSSAAQNYASVPNSTATYQLSQLPPPVANLTDATLQYSLKDFSPNAATKLEGKKTKSKKRKVKSAGEGSPSPEAEWERIFIWDLDETLLVFNSLLDRTYARKFGKNGSGCHQAGLAMQRLVMAVGDVHFFFQDLTECDQVHIDDLTADDTGQDLSGYNFTSDGFLPGSLCLSQQSPLPSAQHAVRGGLDWMRKLAFRYRKMRDLYTMYRDNPRDLLIACDPGQLQIVRNEIEALTDCWHTAALKTLQLIGSRPRYANVLVSNGQLALALVKLLLYGTATAFPVENIYSAAKIGKESCMERIIQRFGKKATYVVVGDGSEEESAARQLRLPFWRVSSAADLQALHQALQLLHL